METKQVCFVDGWKHFGVSGMISLSSSTGLLTNQACHSTALKVLLCPILFLFMCFACKMFPYSDPICGMLSISVSCGIGFLSLCLAPNFWSFTHVVNILCPEGASLFPPSS